MTIMALEYATTVYPVILIGVTYVMVQLYDHNFKLLVWPWKLLSIILKPLRRRWNVKTSLVDVFASFIYLSSARLLLTSINIDLVPMRTFTYLQGPDGELTTAYYLLNSPSMEYFGKNHLPFALYTGYNIVIYIFCFANSFVVCVPICLFPTNSQQNWTQFPNTTNICGCVSRSLQRWHKQH